MANAGANGRTPSSAGHSTAAPAALLTPEDEPLTTGIRSRRIEAERARIRRRHRNSIIRTSLVLLAVLALLIVCGYLAVKILFDRQGEEEIEDYPGPGGAQVEFVVNPGDSGADIGKNLVAADIVKTEAAFLAAWNDNADAASIQPGSYQLRKQMRAVDVVASLLDSTRRTSNAVSVPNGATVRDIAERMKSFAKFSDEEVDAALKDAAGMGLPPEAEGNPEGWLGPGSYEVHTDDSAVDILAAMVKSTKDTLDELRVPEDQRQEVLIKASILDMEVNIDEYLPQVARVIQNRLENPNAETAGFLNMDSTVNYGVGRSGGIPSKEDLKTDTPYNTYLHKGLPPTPIASPSKAAIEATLHPAEGDWLYFVTVNLKTGETKFASTKAEHEANIVELQEWCKANEGEC